VSDAVLLALREFHFFMRQSWCFEQCSVVFSMLCYKTHTHTHTHIHTHIISFDFPDDESCFDAKWKFGC